MAEPEHFRCTVCFRGERRGKKPTMYLIMGDFGNFVVLTGKGRQLETEFSTANKVSTKEAWLEE